MSWKFVVQKFEKDSMRKLVCLAVAALWVSSAAAQELRINRFDMDSLHLEGAQCDFTEKGNGTVLASDWLRKFWMNVDGKLIEFAGTKTDADFERDLKTKRWKERFQAGGITVTLDLKETGRGEDAKEFQGYMDVRRGASAKRIKVTADCGA